MNNITVKVSIGEILDKLSILSIKRNKITDKDKLVHIENEYNELYEKSYHFLDSVDVKYLYEKLEYTNNKLWDIEDRIRELERENIFNDLFIEVARSVYKTNDQRFFYKNKINELTNSEIKEQKGYC